MSLTQHIGYGKFRLDDFGLGELFARFDGTLARVCSEQPIRPGGEPLHPDHLEVWIDYGTSNARKMLLHKSACAHAISEEQAWAIERRHQERREATQ